MLMSSTDVGRWDGSGAATHGLGVNVTDCQTPPRFHLGASEVTWRAELCFTPALTEGESTGDTSDGSGSTDPVEEKPTCRILDRSVQGA